MIKVMIVFSACMALAGCGASMSLKDCQQANWYELGKEKALAGENIQLFYKIQKQCAKKNVVAEEEKFVAGFLDGRKTYCTFDSGFERGFKGGKPNESCPAATKYLAGYEKGIKQFLEEKERRQAESLTRHPAGNVRTTMP